MPGTISIRCLSFFVGYRCNCKCPFCCVETLKGTDDQLLSVDEMKDIIDQGLKLGVVNVALPGGEPLLYMDKLIPLIEYIKSKKALVTIPTTGLTIEKHMNELVRAGVNNIFFSMGGIGEEHDRSRGVAGLFDKAMAGIERAREAGVFVATRGIATKENLADGSLERLIDYLAEHKLMLSATPMYSGSVCNAEDAIEVIPDHLQKELLRLQKEKKNFMLDTFGNIAYPACPAIREWITIMADGEVVPCAGIMTSLGNLREHSLRDILAKGRSLPDFQKIEPRCRCGEDAEFCETWIRPIKGSPLPVRLEEHPRVDDIMAE
ncbi:radical SAM/SPASM domain-containing protein [Thermodesulfobacteriota bacterium]